MRRTFEEELQYYNAKHIVDDIYIGNANMTNGIRIIEGKKGQSGYTSVIISKRELEALRLYLLEQNN